MRRDLEREYAEQMGRTPPVDESDDAWQWDYRGTKEEKEHLLENLGFESAEEEQQGETLF